MEKLSDKKMAEIRKAVEKAEELRAKKQWEFEQERTALPFYAQAGKEKEVIQLLDCEDDVLKNSNDTISVIEAIVQKKLSDEVWAHLYGTTLRMYLLSSEVVHVIAVRYAAKQIKDETMFFIVDALDRLTSLHGPLCINVYLPEIIRFTINQRISEDLLLYIFSKPRECSLKSSLVDAFLKGIISEKLMRTVLASGASWEEEAIQKMFASQIDFLVEYCLKRYYPEINIQL